MNTSSLFACRPYVLSFATLLLASSLMQPICTTFAAVSGLTAQGTGTCHPTLIVTRGDISPEGFRGILLREIVRQSLMIAARDELGIRTWDTILQESAPAPVGYNAIELDLGILFGEDKAHIRLKVRSGGGLDAEPDKHFAFPFVSAPDYSMFIEIMEKMSRSEFVDYLKEIGFKDVKGSIHASEVGSHNGFDQNFERMEYVEQWKALRRAHANIVHHGASPDNLGALVRGYANMGQMTRFFWNATDKAMLARALLYAERMRALHPDSAISMAHRAYARALSEMHAAALADIDMARKKFKQHSEIPPDWLELLDAYCRYDLYKFVSSGEHQSDCELSALLHVVSLRNSKDSVSKMTVLTNAIAKAPDCFAIYDEWCSMPGVSVGHQSTRAAFPAFQQSLYQNMARIKDAPGQLSVAIAQGRKDVENTMCREAAARNKLVQCLFAASIDDHNEPSFALLGNIVKSVTFSQIYRRIHFMARCWAVPVSEYLEAIRPFIIDNPYVYFIESYDLDKNRDGEAYKTLINKIRIADIKPCMHPMLTAVSEINADFQCSLYPSDGAFSDADLIAGDIEQRITEELSHFKKDVSEDGLHSINLNLKNLASISPHSPTRILAEIAVDPNADVGHLSQWEHAATAHPEVALALAGKYSEMREYLHAERMLRSCINQSPSISAFNMLADNYAKQDETDQWLAVMEEALVRVADSGLNRASIRVSIAWHFMKAREWERALPYAEAAASTWAAWAMLCASECHEGKQDWQNAELWQRRCSERYDSASMSWYFWCKRTGQGNLNLARQLAQNDVKKMEESKSSSDRQKAAVYYALTGENEKSYEIWALLFKDTNLPYYGFHAALLAIDANNTKQAQLIFNRIHARAGKYRHAYSNQVASMAGLFLQYLDGKPDDADSDEIKQRMSLYDDGRYRDTHYFVGRYYELHGNRAKALKHFELCLENIRDSVYRSESSNYNYYNRIYAGIARNELMNQ